MDPLAAERALEVGRARFPDVHVDAPRFREYLAARSAKFELRGVDIAHAADLYLASACEGGDARAHAHLYAVVRSLAEVVVPRFGARAPAVDEIASRAGERLLVARADEAPRIARYDGSHALAAWLRVIVLRLTVDALPAADREQPVEDALLESLHAIDDDPELLALRVRDEALVRSVLEGACRALDRRSRRMLRHALVERLTVDEVGELYGVHRSTAARAIRSALETLIARTRVEVRRVGAGDLAGLAHLELSLERWLRSSVEEESKR